MKKKYVNNRNKIFVGSENFKIKDSLESFQLGFPLGAIKTS